MLIDVSDGQIVGETSSTMFTLLQDGPVSNLMVIRNSGVNTMNYRFQEWTGSEWSDLGSSGSDFYNTLTASEVRSFKLTSSYPKVQMIANASGGAFLEFHATRFFNRSSGGAIPILSL
jgi:hypothetical protein